MQRETHKDANPIAPSPDKGASDGKIMTLDEAAEFLNTSYSAVYRLVIDGEFRAFRIRNSWRTSTGACQEFVSRRFEEQSVICRSGETK